MEEALSFGPWLKQRRRILDLTQQELAARAACSLSTLRKIEAGDLLPSKELARLLAVALGVATEEQEAFIAFARDERRAALFPAMLTTPAPAAAPGSADVESAQPPAPAVHPRRSPLPMPLTPLIGRQSELAHVQQLFTRPDCGLVTLVGPGGMGKTRLALAVAHALAATESADHPRFRDGIYFVPLVGVTAPEFIVSTIANTLGFIFNGASEAKTQLLTYLAQKEMLLVLDNLEHLLEGVELLLDLLQGAPGIKLLVTSRQRLNLTAEWVILLEGLTVPPAQPTPTTASPASADAVDLFLFHARRINAHFSAAGQAQAIGRICQLVGGMPLAIEMAAAWLRLLTCQEIEAKISGDLAFLAQPGPGAPARHRSMHALFDHSWRLLQPEEQPIFAQLAVFRGGFGAAAAHYVTGATLVTLASLIDQSLLRKAADGRYDLHELVRQYAEEKLARVDQRGQATRDRHCAFFAKLVADHETALTLGQRPAIMTLRTDVDNLRSAWGWALEQGHTGQLRQMFLGLLFFYNEQSWFGEGIQLFATSLQRWAHRAAASPVTAEQRLVEAYLHLGYTFLRIIQGDYHADRDLPEECQRLFEEQGDQRALALSLFLRGIAATHNGQLQLTKPLLLAALAASQASGFLYGMGATQIALGDLARAFGDRAAAEESYRAVLQLSRQHEAVRGMSLSLTRLGALAKDRGDLAQAQQLLQAGLQAAQPREGLEGDLWSAAENLWRQAEVALEQGKLAAAYAGVKAALQQATERQNNVPAILAAITVAGQICLYEEEVERAVTYLTYTQQQPSTSRENRMTAERLLAAAQQDLSPEQLSAAQIAGPMRPLATIVAEILAW